MQACAEQTLGRYTLHGEIASGGMATVYLGRLRGPVGFSRVVAIKRMHPHIARDPDFTAMFLDEARLAARIQHPNVVSTLDIVAQDGEVFIVMEYVDGASLAALLRDEDRNRIKVGIPIAVGLMVGALAGLHAAHDASTDDGRPLNIVHRDVSPQNILLGLDGLARIVDFGVAKAAVKSGVTRDHHVKGKICYMAPEQLAGSAIDRRADVFAAGAILWEMLAGRRLFGGDDAGAVIAKVLLASVPPLSEHRSDVPPALEAVIRRSLTVKPAQRYATAQDFADALEEAAPKLASPRTVGAWVRARAADAASKQHQLVTRLEQGLSGEISGAVATPSRPGSASVPEAPQPALDGALMPTPPSTPGEASRSPSEAPTRVAGWAAASQEIPVAPALPRGVGMLTPASGVGMIRTPPSGVRMPTPPSGVRMPTPPSGVGMPTPPSGVGMPTPPSAAAAPMPFSTQPVASPLGAIGSIPPPPAYDRRTVVAVIVGCVVALLGLVLILALVMSGSPEHSPPPPTSPP